MDVATRHDAAASRYEITADGELIGVADYRDLGDVVDIHHTEITRDWRGRGMGARLVGDALADLRHRGRAVIPSCWFVAQYVREHPGSVSAASAPNSTGE